MSEDDLLGLVAEHFRAAGFFILADSANQGSAFRFKIGQAAKVPDFVAFKNDVLLVGECKVRPGDLFGGRAGKRSDFACMSFLARSTARARLLAREASVRIGMLGHEIDPEKIMVCPAVIALGSLVPYEHEAAQAGVLLFSIDPSAMPAVAFGGFEAGNLRQLFGQASRGTAGG